jgi:hypothetical protein
MREVDCVYIAASLHDSRYTRICVASVRFFYPEIPIRLLRGGQMQRGLTDELSRYWGVSIAEIPAGEYGWGFVKLEVLFGKPGERFLVLDSDTVLTGPLLDVWSESGHLFLVDDESQSESDMKRLYYDWEKLSKVDPSAQPPQFVFNSGQWFGTAGVLTRKDFAPWLKWTLPRRTLPSGYFMNGEQGVLNYVLNRKAAEGLPVGRMQIMRWPGRSMIGFDAKRISERTAPSLVIHWAGVKRTSLGDMVGNDILLYFEKFYYSRLPAGASQRLLANCQHSFTYGRHWLGVRIKFSCRRWMQTLVLPQRSQVENRSVET